MERWQDQGIVLAARPHGERGAVVSLLTEHHGRHAGYLHGAVSSKNRGLLEPGNIVDTEWSAKIEGNLGNFSLELARSHAPRFMQDSLKLAALQAACALCDQALPEREGHPGLFHGFQALLETLESAVWGEAYVLWEIALLKELGFSLDISRCAGGGATADLTYVSPKTGRAVSAAAGAPYKDRLLLLPAFLKPVSSLISPAGGEENGDILTGLKLTGYFLEHWVFAHHTHGVPDARRRFQLRFETRFAKTEELSS